MQRIELSEVKTFGINKVALTLDIQVGHFPKNTPDNLAMAFVSDPHSSRMENELLNSLLTYNLLE